MTEFLPCPGDGCGMEAAVLERDLLETTSGPLTLVKLTCPKRHHYLMEEPA